mmetsp:Transcript_53706/g.114635  ORF Transcript_53706/g.114635 Transcript_53706/m.114635 type:complete len:80 (+) Transcript_53706:11-250(+)
MTTPNGTWSVTDANEPDGCIVGLDCEMVGTQGDTKKADGTWKEKSILCRATVVQCKLVGGLPGPPEVLLVHWVELGSRG